MHQLHAAGYIVVCVQSGDDQLLSGLVAIAMASVVIQSTVAGYEM